MNAQNTPAARIIARFGVPALAGWTGRHRSRIHAWTWPTDKGGTGGAIPIRRREAIIAGAKRDLHQDVEPAEFELQPGEAYLVPEDRRRALAVAEDVQ